MFGPYVQGHYINARLWIEHAVSAEFHANAHGT